MTSHRVRLAPLAAKCFEQKDPHFAFMSMALADVVELLSCRRFEIGSRYPYGLLDLGKPMKYRHASVERALCNGKTLAFQARDAGSIPAARSKNLAANSALRWKDQRRRCAGTTPALWPDRLLRLAPMTGEHLQSERLVCALDRARGAYISAASLVLVAPARGDLSGPVDPA